MFHQHDPAMGIMTRLMEIPKRKTCRYCMIGLAHAVAADQCTLPATPYHMHCESCSCLTLQAMRSVTRDLGCSRNKRCETRGWLRDRGPQSVLKSPGAPWSPMSQLADALGPASYEV